ncbi:hypothetical protein Tdes44962_MAKER03541 [Teratosphaeria destructans]|uniref:Uncharacterized protein n=1 Tax=Teratosphaeria destructans TaxID=418781 RepID=A0A9W7W157_9PEZI|nr:hypothetical protein Tdes44962_MAKER03541 [Teratosphaeria destructans]
MSRTEVSLHGKACRALLAKKVQTFSLLLSVLSRGGGEHGSDGSNRSITVAMVDGRESGSESRMCRGCGWAASMVRTPSLPFSIPLRTFFSRCRT